MEILLSYGEKRFFFSFFCAIIVGLLFVSLVALASNLMKIWNYDFCEEPIIYESVSGAGSTDQKTTPEYKAQDERSRDMSRRSSNFKVKVRSTWNNIEGVIKSLKEQGRNFFLMALPI